MQLFVVGDQRLKKQLAGVDTVDVIGEVASHSLINGRGSRSRSRSSHFKINSRLSDQLNFY